MKKIAKKQLPDLFLVILMAFLKSRQKWKTQRLMTKTQRQKTKMQRPKNKMQRLQYDLFKDYFLVAI